MFGCRLIFAIIVIPNKLNSCSDDRQQVYLHASQHIQNKDFLFETAAVVISLSSNQNHDICDPENVHHKNGGGGSQLYASAPHPPSPMLCSLHVSDVPGSLSSLWRLLDHNYSSYYGGPPPPPMLLYHLLKFIPSF